MKLIFSYVSGLPFNDPIHKLVDFSMLSFNPETMLKSFVIFRDSFIDRTFPNTSVVSSAYWHTRHSKSLNFIPYISLQLFHFSVRISLAILKSLLVFIIEHKPPPLQSSMHADLSQNAIISSVGQVMST